MLMFGKQKQSPVLLKTTSGTIRFTHSKELFSLIVICYPRLSVANGTGLFCIIQVSARTDYDVRLASKICRCSKWVHPCIHTYDIHQPRCLHWRIFSTLAIKFSESTCMYCCCTSVCVCTERESKTLRMCDIHELLHQLPEPNFEMLKTLIAHLKRWAFLF